MEPTRRQKAPRPLDDGRLEELALRYVGRFATTQAKLRSYLTRKLRERGWSGEGEPDVASIAERFANRGYVDDASFALAKSQSLTARGYGKRRVLDALKVAGVEADQSVAAREHADTEAISAALRFARRKRLGPFAEALPSDPQARQKAIAAMVRAGHGFDLARTILALEPGTEVDVDQLMA